MFADCYVIKKLTKSAPFLSFLVVRLEACCALHTLLSFFQAKYLPESLQYEPCVKEPYKVCFDQYHHQLLMVILHLITSCGSKALYALLCSLGVAGGLKLRYPRGYPFKIIRMNDLRLDTKLRYHRLSHICHLHS